MMITKTALAALPLTTLLIACAATPVARADIFQWKYINPANPSLGKQQSTTLCTGGAGANAVPGANLGGRNLTMGYLIGADLTGAYTAAANLTNADLSQANLTQAHFRGGGGIYDTSPAPTLSGANFSHANLTNADFSGYVGFDPADPGVYYYLGADLTGVSFVQANLTGANFVAATLSGANLTGTEVRGANFPRASVEYFPYYGAVFGGISLAQLYSTASYQAHDLTGIGLSGNSLGGANLAGQNLASANFSGANLTGAALTGAEIRNANFNRQYPYLGYGGGLNLPQLYSTASYLAHDLNGVALAGNDFTGASLAGQNLANATFHGATMANADLSGATLTNARFSAFYYLYPGANLSGAKLTRADLANADFSSSYDLDGADLTGADLSQARLTNAKFNGLAVPVYDDDGAVIGEEIHQGANLTGANLSGADARGANFQYATLTGANTTNLIQSNGHIAGLNLTSSASLVVRDYDGNPPAAPPTGPLPIVVDQHLAMNATGTLQLVFDADPWDSTISFAPGISVVRGGTLELTFAKDVNLASQLGRTIDLFDWAGVNPTGAFNVSSPYTWDLSKLYTTGEVTLTSLAAIPGDFNNNGVVDTADYIIWRKTDGTPAGYNAWRAHFGQPPGSGATGSASASPNAVPEPASLSLLLFIAIVPFCRSRCRSTNSSSHLLGLAFSSAGEKNH
jgi:uncharacterized protein YjbI with pentapeptide repeats